MSKYLDNTGAQHLITKIKTLLAGKSDTGHKHTKSEITDFPTIPTVNNATLTIQKNGSSVGTFTANASANKSINITVPTKVSELTNDSGFKTTDTTYSPATTTADGLMSSSDKKNLTYFVQGTQTASTNKWTGSLPNVELYDGLTIRYYLPYAGTSTSATLALNGGTAYPIYRLGRTTTITTQFGVGSIITMTFRSSYSVAGTAYTNAWIVDAYYYKDTNTQVRLYKNETGTAYPVIGSRTVYGSVTNGSTAVYGEISDQITMNPTIGELAATNFKGKINNHAIESDVPANAKFTDTTYSAITNARIDELYNA